MSGDDRISGRLSRRTLLCRAAVAAGAAFLPKTAASATAAGTRERWHTVVVGAGAFGAWTAWHLQRRAPGESVLLVDAWGPAHARASSGGESRLTRALYGGDELYTRLARSSLNAWRALSADSGLPVFHEIGALYFFREMTPEIERTVELHRSLELPLELLSRDALVQRYPQVGWDGIEFGLLEPDFGVLMARRAVQTLVRQFVAAGGTYRQAAVLPPGAESAGRTLASVSTADGGRIDATRFVFACGAWLPKLFPETLRGRIHATRQDVAFLAPPTGDARFASPSLPAWVDAESLYYGFPDLEGRGFKIASDRHGPRMDPDAGDRQLSAQFLEAAREFIRRRFPALARQPLNEGRVCQYENSANGDFLADRHPSLENAWLVGAGSGHGFKHGPAVGQYVADLVTGQLPTPEPRFSLASKARS